MDFPYYRSITKCEKRFVKLFAYKTTVLENSFSIKAETKTCRLVTAELRLNVNVNERLLLRKHSLLVNLITQLDGRGKKTANKRDNNFV